jgi:mRNA interferase MazF
LVGDISRGQVWWVEVPAAGRRPALVLTRTAAVTVLNRVIVAPATRTVRGIPTEVALDRADGMPEDCALSMDNVTVVAKSALRSLICTLGPNKMDAVCTALRVAVDC